MICCVMFCSLFFFKQKTAYEMRISDWSSDVCSSDLGDPESIEALDYWVSLVRDQKASPIGLNGADADKLFQTGKAAIEIVGPWMTTGFDEAGLNYGLAKPFAGPSAENVLADVVSMGLPDRKSTRLNSSH